MMEPNGSAAALPRLLAGISGEGPLTLHAHAQAHGPRPAAEGRHGGALIAEVERAALRGRGGGAFPLARKMKAVAARGGAPVVLVNGTEGEPASLKDRTLLEALPHLVLDGAALAAEALGSEEVVVGLSEGMPAAVAAVRRAVDERHGSEPVSFSLVSAPKRYVAGQEMALISLINGGPALPTFTPPLAFERGVRRRPTLVSNVETLAHLALIARHGADWFRALGTPTQPGSLLITLSGPVAHPGVYEIESGASLSSLLDAAGGLTVSARAALVGGYAGTWIDGSLLRGVALSDEHLAPYGATVSAGVLALLSANACPAGETTRVARWLANQSAHQCGPCTHGLDEMARTLEGITSGAAGRRPSERVAELCALVVRRGACAHPDGSARFVQSAVEVFAEEFADHARHGVCDACAGRPELPLPAEGRSGREPRERELVA